MNFRELHACTRRTLHGRYVRVLGASLLYPSVWLLLKCIPCVLAGVLIAQGTMHPKALLFDGLPLWLLFSALWSILRFGVLMPLRCGTCGWFTALTGLERYDEPAALRRPAVYWKAVRFFLGVEMQRMLALLPCVLGLSGAWTAFRCSIGLPEGGFPLFLAAQCLCIAAAGGLYYLRFCIGIAAVPFLWLEEPDGSPFRAVRRSIEMLRGHHTQFILLWLRYLPAALPVVTVPFLLPQLMTDYTLFLQIHMREWEQKEEIYANTAISHESAGAVQA